MTLEELADNTADKLEALSQEQLEAILKPYFPQTRPEIVQVNRPNVRISNEPAVILTKEKQAALALLAAEGCDVSELLKRRKRR